MPSLPILRSGLYQQVTDGHAGPEAGLPGRYEQNLVHHTRVYAVADKYDIPYLKELAVEYFRANCFWYWQDSDFPHAVREMYETTPDEDRGLRDAVLDTVESNMSLLDKEHFKSTIRDSLLAYDLLYRVAV